LGGACYKGGSPKRDQGQFTSVGKPSQTYNSNEGLLTVLPGVGTMHTTFLPREVDLKRQSIQKEIKLMTKDEIYGKVSEIIVEQLGADESDITMEASFRDDLEADSLDLVELIMAFEEEFGGEISDEEAQEITTVGQAVEYLHGHQ